MIPPKKRIDLPWGSSVWMKRVRPLSRGLDPVHVAVEVAGRRTSLALGRPAEQGPAIATGLFALLLGVTQAFGAPDIDVATLPSDLRPLFEGEAPVDAFLRLGRWLVEGSR